MSKSPDFKRSARVGLLLRKEIGHLVQRDVKDPALGLVAITDVVASPDLRVAHVYVSALGSDEARRASVTALNRARPYLRSRLHRLLRLKRVPELVFELDTSIEYGARIQEVLDEVLPAEEDDAGG